MPSAQNNSHANVAHSGVMSSAPIQSHLGNFPKKFFGPKIWLAHCSKSQNQSLSPDNRSVHLNSLKKTVIQVVQDIMYLIRGISMEAREGQWIMSGAVYNPSFSVEGSSEIFLNFGIKQFHLR